MIEDWNKMIYMANNDDRDRQPSCPKCRGAMTLRQGPRGAFYGCRAFPRCRGTLNAQADGRVATPAAGTPVQVADLTVPADAAPVSISPRGPQFVLDFDQQAVCDHRSGEGVAAAAAGSGKSTVLVERTADLLAEGTLPEGVLLLTFNRDAALSLRAKLAARLGAEAAGRVRAFTYHSYCLALLRKWHPGDRRFNSIVGAPRSEAPSKAAILRPILRDLRLEGEADEWAGVDERIREAGIDLSANDAVEAVADSRWGDGSRKLAMEIVDVCRAYAAAKRERQLIDFTDLLCMVAEEFARPDSTRARDAATFAHVMVDEAQDTNVVQQRIARHLGASARSLLWVGDLRQSIYGWRGAAPALLTDRVAAGAALLPIRTCRRSTAAIVEAGNAIARGRDWHLGGDSLARPDAPAGERPIAQHGAASDVADAVAAAVKAGAAPSDFAALARVNSALPDLECSLVARGLPVRVLGSQGGVWTTQIGRLVRGYLHAAEGRATEDFSRIANRPLRFVKAEIANRAKAEADRGRPLFAALRAQYDRAAGALVIDLERLAGLDYAARCAAVADLLIKDVEERAAGLETEPDEDRLETIRALAKAATEIGSVKAIEEQIAAIKRAGENAPAVVLATTHRSKGLEWAHVFVVAPEGHFPHAKAEDTEEERRLFYVATTRAATSLTYMVPDGAKASSFLYEMGDAVDMRLGDGPEGDGDGPDGGSDEDEDGADEADGAAEARPALVEEQLADAAEAFLDTGRAAAIARDLFMAPRVVEDARLYEKISGDEAHAYLDREQRRAEALGRVERRLTVDEAPDEDGGGEPPRGFEAPHEVGPLAGPTPTDEEMGPDAEPGDGSRYVPVRLAAVRALLEPRGFKGAVADRGNQYVFIKTLRPYVTVRVYTTIPVGDTESREAGEDSIRITAIWTLGAERPLLAREPWVCRTASWRNGILGRVERVEAALANIPPCPKCGAPTRERTGARGPFRGCITYPTCNGTINPSMNTHTNEVR